MALVDDAPLGHRVWCRAATRRIDATSSTRCATRQPAPQGAAARCVDLCGAARHQRPHRAVEHTPTCTLRRSSKHAHGRLMDSSPRSSAARDGEARARAEAAAHRGRRAHSAVREGETSDGAGFCSRERSASGRNGKTLANLSRARCSGWSRRSTRASARRRVSPRPAKLLKLGERRLRSAVRERHRFAFRSSTWWRGSWCCTCARRRMLSLPGKTPLPPLLPPAAQAAVDTARKGRRAEVRRARHRTSTSTTSGSSPKRASWVDFRPRYS